jgi:hypothetical protein
MGGLSSRFVAEVVFLALLAAAAALAELRPALIVGVMAAGWLLVVLIEWLAWRGERLPSAPPPPPTRARRTVPEWDLDDLLGPLPGGTAGEEEPTRLLPPGEGR